MLMDRTVRRLETTEDTRTVLTQPKSCHVGDLHCCRDEKGGSQCRSDRNTD